MILRFFRLVGALLSFLCSGFMSLTLVSSITLTADRPHITNLRASPTGGAQLIGEH